MSPVDGSGRAGEPQRRRRPRPDVDFGAVVRRAAARNELLVQPRMGMSDPDAMRQGLQAVKSAQAPTVGTITLDSYTRCNDDAAAERALAAGDALNGYPIVALGSKVTAPIIDAVADRDFAIQVRHGSPAPQRIFRTMAAAGINATEGGPLSYCLPYSREPVRDAVAHWAECCEFLRELGERGGGEPHIETFGGCMMGQLCPPSLLIAISVLEALFFRQHGLRSVSVSYAQQANADQDAEALSALRAICRELLADVDWHVVLYAYMGVYPTSISGAQLLLDDAARLAVRGGTARLIVKTAAEAYRIPTVEENVAALEEASSVAAAENRHRHSDESQDTGIRAEARLLIDNVIDLHSDLGRALVIAMRRGLLDIPYCLHPDNLGRARSYLDRDGRLYWAETGALPLPPRVGFRGARDIGSSEFRQALNFVAAAYDTARPPPSKPPPPGRRMTASDQLSRESLDHD